MSKVSFEQKMYRVYIRSKSRKNLSFYGDLISVYGILAGLFEGEGVAINTLEQIVESGKKEARFELITPLPLTGEKQFSAKYISFREEEFDDTMAEICIYPNKNSYLDILLHCIPDVKYIACLVRGITQSKPLGKFVFQRLKLKQNGRKSMKNTIPHLLVNTDNFPLVSKIKLHQKLFKEWYAEVWNAGSVKAVEVRAFTALSFKFEHSFLVQYVKGRPHARLFRERKVITVSLVQQTPTAKKDVKYKELIVHGGTGKCPESQVHKNVPFTASVPVFNKKDEVAPVEVKSNYCSQCKAWFITDSEYSSLIKKGLVCCRNAAYGDYSLHKENYLNPESEIFQYGYNVNQREGLTISERRRILFMVIKVGIWTKQRVIRFLKWRMRFYNKENDMSLALSKYEMDCDYVKTL